MSFLNDKWARNPMKKFRQGQTVTVDDLAQSMLEGYTGKEGDKGAMEHRPEGSYPKIRLATFTTQARLQIADVYKRWSPAGAKKGVSVIKRGYNGQYLHITSSDQNVLADELKKLGIIYVNKRLRNAKTDELGGIEKELARREKATKEGKPGGLTAKQMRMKPEDRLANMGGVGETFAFRSGYNVAHQGASTVGGARFIAAQEWLKNSDYKRYVKSAEFKTLKSRFPDFEVFFETSGMKESNIHGTKIHLKEGMRIGSTIGPSSANFSGSELNDWGKGTGNTISRHLGDSLTAWAKRQNWIDMKGSNSIREQAMEVARTIALAGVSTSKTSKKSSKPRKVPKRNAKRDKLGAPGVAAVVRSTGHRNKESRAKKTVTRRTQNSEGISPFTYVAMINKKLPQTVAKNMRSPMLQNNSGRFASSVRVETADLTAQGHPSFGYTYDKSPYQVFEVGTGSAPWATPDRDPRKLIDKSIREVAAQLAIGRFYTRRL